MNNEITPKQYLTELKDNMFNLYKNRHLTKEQWDMFEKTYNYYLNMETVAQDYLNKKWQTEKKQ